MAPTQMGYSVPQPEETAPVGLSVHTPEGSYLAAIAALEEKRIKAVESARKRVEEENAAIQRADGQLARWTRIRAEAVARRDQAESILGLTDTPAIASDGE